MTVSDANRQFKNYPMRPKAEAKQWSAFDSRGFPEVRFEFLDVF